MIALDRRCRHVQLATWLGIVAILAAACADDVPEGVTEAGAAPILAVDTPPETPAEGMEVEEAAALSQAPAAEPRDPLPAIQAPTVPETVELHRPDLLVRPADPAEATLYSAFGVEGVEHLSGASAFEAVLVGPDGEEHDVSVLAVDPTTFRPLTPDVTAQEPGVWQRLTEGDVVVRHDVAFNLGLELGGDIALRGAEQQLDARIGAFASNGAPPLADLIVPWEVGAQLGAGDVNLLVLALAEDASSSRAGPEVVEAIGGGEFEVRDAPVEQQARIVGTGARAHFEPFTYTDLGDGMIVIDPAWVRKWIVTVELPGLGRTRCHRVMAEQLMAAIGEIRAEGLYGHFKPEQFAGCWVPRHIDWSPSRPLSMHAWGLAIDFNSIDNALGRTPQMDPRIVAIFEKWGFEWGGRWRRPDGMHFELDRVIDMG